ncbi:MAG TPA: YicC family protein [Verrucomicrobiales bacterium]|nr:YicC family protein [Verrucomicrobiales bacterium]|tara:strand:+ start:2358 stop:3233 length:876 start_codon:yes stop_codon:yes gene_type:complete
MNSMTGYGRGEAARGGAKFTVEISTVNRKQAELSLYLPRELDALESRARDEINAKVSRGRIAARVQWTAKSGDRAQVEIDRNLAKEYAKEYRKLATDLKLGGEVSLDTILRAPGVLQTSEEELDVESLWTPLRTAVRAALKELLAMRAREGANLKKDLQKRVDALQKSVKAVKRQAPRTVRRHREALLDRLNQSGLDLKLDDERVLKEVALFADRIDITEELTRLESHFGQFADYAKSKGPVGRTLDFLSQEMNREVNTIGSKANDPLISRLVVAMKSELEKFREQVQNVE